MEEVCYGRVDVADHHEAHRNINPSRKNVDHREIQNDNYDPVGDGLDKRPLRRPVRETHSWLTLISLLGTRKSILPRTEESKAEFA
jgi:hypothetical protein